MRERLSWWLPVLTNHWETDSPWRHTYTANWGRLGTQTSARRRLHAAWRTWWALMRFRFTGELS